jgi:hypothetical protein
VTVPDRLPYENTGPTVELKEGTNPVTLLAFNRPIGVVVPYADYVKLCAGQVSEPSEPGCLVGLDAHAYRLARAYAKALGVSIGVAVSNLIREVKEANE